MVRMKVETLLELHIGSKKLLKTRDSVCHWGLGEPIPSWSFTLRNHELIYHTPRCIDMFTHDCHSDIRCVFLILSKGIAKIDPQLALKRQAKVIIYGM